jgi:ribosomal protein S27E
MKEYNIFTDPEFKADCARDQILYDKSTYTHVMKVKCSWCGEDMGVKPCSEEQQNKISHSICESCNIRVEKEISVYEEVR